MASWCIYSSLLVFVWTSCLASSLVERRQEMFLRTMDALKSTQDSHTIVHSHRPVRTTRSGNFLEFATLNALSHHLSDGTIRKRRSLPPRDVRDELDASSATEDGNHEVFFDLGHSDGSPLSGARLHLRRNYKLVTKNFMVEELGRGGKVSGRHSMVEECHYTGVIHNHDAFSKVALSLCNGLQGIILKDDDMFFIEPLWNHSITNKSENVSRSSLHDDMDEEEDSHPHVIVKRSALEHLQERRKDKDDLGHCGYSDEVNGKDTPWWRVDPRESARKRSEEEKEEDVDQKDEFDVDMEKTKKHHKHHRHHHHKSSKNHRTSAGRSQVKKEETLDRKKRSTDQENVRRRRSVSLERHVETMVVADKTLVRYHGRQEVERYILTIMNVVANLYHDASIGNPVNILVTRIVILTEDQPDLQISHHGDQTLNSFCRWQSGININGTSAASESGLAHHDNAVLITGFDICTYLNEPCGTLGLAPVAGMCETERSCSINEDIGLASAFTIAHEIGHNFGMQHDGTRNDCGPKNGEPSQIMAAQLTKNASPFSWSGCSKQYITDFLDSGSGHCLLDVPPLRDFSFPEEMPGQMHDADEQCRFQYGAQSRHCKIGDVCRDLWCLSKNDQCVTNSIPAAEGTTCNVTDDMSKGWCYRGGCVPFGYRPQAVDGSWGDWSAWSECSRSCGSGASSSSRSCDNPAPEHGGKYCIGERMRYKICNTGSCPDPQTDFRHEQCARLDNEPFRGKYYNWVPYVGEGRQVKPCALNCLAQGYNFYTERASAVIDGTRCFADSLDICIKGECHHVGCDNVLHSKAVEDKCRVCGGDGSTCHTEMGVFNLPVMHGLYHHVAVIPKGSVNIFIEEVERSKLNYIALGNIKGVNYINGNYTIDWPRKLKIAGTTFSYKRPTKEPESLQALGPTSEDLVITVLLQEPNRGIRYEYNVPIERHGSGDTESAFLWDHGDWTPCTASCAGGTQKRPVICRRVDDDTVVSHSYCAVETMPVEHEQSCNAEPCPPTWSTGYWSECSRTCGGGHRTRNVMCMRKISQTEDEVVHRRYCTDRRPPASESCNTDVCPPQWDAGQWSSCKPRCGPGHKTRDVTCMSSDRRINYDDDVCDALQKPSTRMRCNNGPCPTARWMVSQWSQCSAQCGRGQKRRRVACMTPDKRPSNDCTSHKPRSILACETPCARPPSSEPCEDDPKVDYCRLVLKYKFCHRAYFRKMCCGTCSGKKA
ncbi:A disintegrin and metalloproteinase with thrombospondin motifs 6-like isoform X1 [Clavelina lepadiformis]|uniref:A disintegrin and metalloproteinase with thrombospondin motifs 6-like isoform X1 n=1 Tax=Clavelina lepadiformis TaxID=159417 RepID=UPI00404249EC